MPELAVVTDGKSIEESVAEVLRYVEDTFSLSAREQAVGWGL